ncbi:hypothetical protein [Asticcacaulis sp. W401b]|uniref:hypothetical protein n=1 Tax=Asticcacaulis sp. W401b TaxID=3388666 RepID=UPI003970C1C4
MAELSLPAEAMLSGLEAGGFADLAAETRSFLLENPRRRWFESSDPTPYTRARLAKWELRHAGVFVEKAIDRELYLRKRIIELSETLGLDQVRVLDPTEAPDSQANILSSSEAIDSLTKFKRQWSEAIGSAWRRGEVIG